MEKSKNPKLYNATGNPIYSYNLTVNGEENQFEAIDEFDSDGKTFRILRQVTQVKEVTDAGYGAKIIAYEKCTNPLYVYLDMDSVKGKYSSPRISRPFAFADRVYNDGYAPVITTETYLNGSKQTVTYRYIQYYNPSEDMLLDAKFNDRYYVLGDEKEDSVNGKYHKGKGTLGGKTIVSRRINWPLVISKNPINFYFVPNEKLQSKNFVRECKRVAKQCQYNQECLIIDEPAYKDLLEEFIKVDAPTDDKNIKLTSDNYAPFLKFIYTKKLAEAKAELEAQGITFGNR